MNTHAFRTVLAAGVIALAGCGGGGGGNTPSAPGAPAAVTFTADQMILKGQASWPGAIAVSVEIDGAPGRGAEVRMWL